MQVYNHLFLCWSHRLDTPSGIFQDGCSLSVFSDPDFISLKHLPPIKAVSPVDIARSVFTRRSHLMVHFSANCLDYDVLEKITSFLGQHDLSVLCRTCKEWRAAALRPLYSHIYITEIPSLPSSTGVQKLQQLQSWTIVYNGLSDPCCPLRLLDRTLANSSSLCSLVEEIATDDTVFVIFKLQGWIRRYFSGENTSLKSVFYGNVPLSHFLIGYDSLRSVYLSVSVLHRLTTIQIRNIQDLIGVCQFAKNNNVDLQIRKVCFYLTDTLSHNSTPFDKNLSNALSRVTHCEIESSSNRALIFLRGLEKTYGPDVFPRLKSFSFSHFHSSSNNSTDVRGQHTSTYSDLNLFSSMSTIEELSCRIGCSYLPLNTAIENEDAFEAIYVSEQNTCRCLPLFFDSLNELIERNTISLLVVERIGPLCASDPYAIYHFKRNLATMLSKVKLVHSIKTLILDLGCQLMPNWAERSNNTSLAKSMNYANNLILRYIRRLDSTCAKIPDYFQSFFFWMNFRSESGSNLVELVAHHCSQCRQTFRDIKDFVSVNSEIQFYLDPTYKKPSIEFFYDLFELLLVIRKDPALAYAMQKESTKKGRNPESRKLGVSQLKYSIPFSGEIAGIVEKNLLNCGFSLHSIFHHERYMDLIDSRGVKSANHEKIRCGCEGNEFQRFLIFIEHFSQMPKKLSGTKVN